MSLPINFASRLFSKAVLCASALILNGCGTLNKMTENFEAKWAKSDKELFNELTGEEVRAASIENQLAALERDVATNNCDSALNRRDGLGETAVPSRDARIFIANCDLKENSIDRANEQFELLLTQARDAAVLEGLGVVAVRLQNFDLAAGYLNEAIMLDTERWRSWNALGVALDVQGAPEEAAEAFQKAAALNPNSPAPYNNLGVLHMKQKQYVDAISAFNEALAIDPDLEAADNNYRIALALNGDYENALAGASEAQLAQFLNNAGVAASARGDLPSAKKFLKAALNESPTFYATAYENLIRLPDSAGE